MSTQTASSQTTRKANRLIHSTSPYLLQHAHNPVDWYPWGPEAFERARREDKPIFLSIGYAACHWCHVMERESFENEDIAVILDEHFVAIKVDREERPDLDDLYMSATLVYNQGQGGWPMSVFLTPDQKPFFAGTYFPPTSRWGRPGFRDVLLSITRVWNEQRDQVTQSAEALTDAVRRMSDVAPSDGGVTLERVSQLVGALARVFDPRRGGLTSEANKFPPSLGIGLMLREHLATARAEKPDKRLLELVELTLDHMARGGIYDHLGGGIARYSTDPDWLVPHFEKMLYDQALVSTAYLEGFKVTGNRRWADVAGDILNYVLADLRSPEGGFYSSRDADSEGVEGKYYVWTKEETVSLLGREAGELFCGYYDVTDAGNWEGKNILNIQRPLETVARLNCVELEVLRRTLADGRATLLDARAKRVPPGLDDKVLTSWNGLMIAALARGGRQLEEPKHTAAASAAAEFILTRMTDSEGRLLRAYRKGQAHTLGFLDDYAYFVDGLLELYEATFDKRWLTEAARLTDQMIVRFRDERDGAFFTTAADAESLIVRAKDTRDGATPAGNSVAVLNLLRLAHLLDRTDLLDKADLAMKTLTGRVGEIAYGCERLLAAVHFSLSNPRKIVLVGDPARPETKQLLRAVDRACDFNRVMLLLDPADPDTAAWQQKMVLLQGKTQLGDKPTAYVCRNRTCSRPVTAPEDLARLLQTP
ncbi:MAG TPA: thioredoxin domain-containing protein [Phycisphaerae bacterium]|nr:thioredoxin domain-containing protein [Phycisphaerae bacterium]